MSEALTVRFRVDFGSRCSVGIGKIELLEAIDRSGSLSQAARLLKMSYRRAWLLMADLNASFDQPVVDTTTGGAHGGGAVLTPLGGRLGGLIPETRIRPPAARRPVLERFARADRLPAHGQTPSTASIEQAPRRPARRRRLNRCGPTQSN